VAKSLVCGGAFTLALEKWQPHSIHILVDHHVGLIFWLMHAKKNDDCSEKLKEKVKDLGNCLVIVFSPVF